jgi:hypothetical protein
MRMKSVPSIMMLASLILLLMTRAVVHAQGSPGAPSTLLFYSYDTGAGATGRITDDGLFEQTGQTGFSPEWRHIVNTRNGVIFYNDKSGVVAVARANTDGSMTTLTVGILSPWFDEVVSTENGVMFYRRDGSALIGHVASDGRLVVTQQLAQGALSDWTTIVALPGDRLFFYHYDGTVAAGYIHPSGVFVQTDARYYEMARRFDNVIPVAGAGVPSILFYEREEGASTVAFLDAAGKISLRPASCAPPMQPGYDFIVQSGRWIFFYSWTTGAYAIGALAGNEVINRACRGQLRMESVGYLSAGYTEVVSIDGRLFLYMEMWDPLVEPTDGSGLVATISPTGSLELTTVYDGGSFYPRWSDVLAVGD